MKSEKKAKKILRSALAEIRELGYYIHIPCMGVVFPKEGITLARDEQFELVAIPDELKRQDDHSDS